MAERYKQKSVLIFMMLLAWISLPATGNVYSYTDSFETGKISDTALSHSILWPQFAYPPDEPYLVYCDDLGNSGTAMLFMDSSNQPAQLTYAFPVQLSTSCLKGVTGTMSFNLTFPIAAGSAVHFSYSLSRDGHRWTKPVSLGTGFHQVAIASETGRCYIRFLGCKALLDNLSVTLSSAKADLIVPGPGYLTIQDAIDAAVPGQIIEVLPGTYTGPGNRDLDFQGKALTLRSAAGPDVTILDCQGQAAVGGAHRGFYFHSGETSASILCGFMIRNGYMPGDEPAEPSVPWSSLAGHSIGGGIYCEYSSPTIVNCTIVSCGAQIGGGIGCVGSNAVILDSRIQNCVAGPMSSTGSGGYGGGVAFLLGEKGTLANCIISNNQGYINSQGAGVYVYQAGLNLFGCDISENKAPGFLTGGGLYLKRPGPSVIQNCLITRNSAHNGAAIWSQSNTADSEWLRIQNCTIADNHRASVTLPLPCGGISVTSGSFSIRNSIIYNNDDSQLCLNQIKNSATVQYCNVQGGWPGVGNIDVNPLFAASGMGNAADYHLQSQTGRYDSQARRWIQDVQHSPCIDMGAPLDFPGSEPWPQGRRVNLGAYGQTGQASKSRLFRMLHVDRNLGLDSNNGLDKAAAFRTIQAAVNSARDTDTVFIWPGYYVEQVNLVGKAITVQSAAQAAFIQAPFDYAFLFNFVEKNSAVLRNLIILNSPRAIVCTHSSPVLSNLTIVNNGTGIFVEGDSHPVIQNNIFWNNQYVDVFCDSNTKCKLIYNRFSLVQTGNSDGSATNVTSEPLFADTSKNDFHLLSKYGRLTDPNDPNLPGRFQDRWQTDNITSPCVDGADPAVNPVREGMPNGGRLNMGAFGGTPLASKSLWPLTADVDRSGMVDMYDFIMLAGQWLLQDQTTTADINHDGFVNLADIDTMAQQWLDRLPWVQYQGSEIQAVESATGSVGL